MDEPINQRKYAELQTFRILKDLEYQLVQRHHFSDEETYNGSDDQVTSKIIQLIELSLESKIPDIWEINSVSEIRH